MDKTCERCSETKPHTSFGKYANDRYDPICRKCREAKRNSVDKKKCPRCELHKPITKFQLLKAGKRDTYCLPCRKEYRELHHANRSTDSRACLYPDCGRPVGEGKRNYCDDHSNAAARIASKNATRKSVEYIPSGIDRAYPCMRCSVLPLCNKEIWRPTYWPPCMKASKHYDPKLARRIWQHKTEKAGAIRADGD